MTLRNLNRLGVSRESKEWREAVKKGHPRKSAIVLGMTKEQKEREDLLVAYLLPWQEWSVC